jgi:pyruvate dehydrogenase E1 component
LIRDKVVGPRVVPIVSDETRTFGMEGMFRQVGMYAPMGQLYRPQDADQLMWYREDKTGQILQEGISEAGAICSWLAAGTSYSTHGVQTIPFFIFYSMFGFQRIGDFIWAGGDMRTRGFLLGGTAGRTTLNGEGLQHEDGQSHIMASFIPNCISYDPTFAYEVAVIVQDGLRRMIGEQEDVFYYITVMNENYHHPAMPEGSQDGIIRGLYKLHSNEAKKNAPRVQLMGSGTILREVIAAGEMLKGYGVASDVWSATSMNELRRDGLDVQRWNMLHPGETPRTTWVEQQLAGHTGPVVSATDYIKTYSEQIRPFMPDRRFVTLGTDGFGRSDTREKLREFFEVDRRYVTIAALSALADEGTIEPSVVKKAMATLSIDPEKPNPTTV